MYPKSYHKAVGHLVSFGCHGGNRTQGRKYIADALRAFRSQSRQVARLERLHMLFISGGFPVKEVQNEEKV
jgi:diaminopimelate decarboxylase